jgi:hypothetical protein
MARPGEDEGGQRQGSWWGSSEIAVRCDDRRARGRRGRDCQSAGEQRTCTRADTGSRAERRLAAWMKLGLQGGERY